MAKIDELVAATVTLRKQSEQLSVMLGSAENMLSQSASRITSILGQSRAGQDAVVSLSVASRSLSNAAASMRTLVRACDECEKHYAGL